MKILEKYFYIITAVFVFIVYLFTIAPSVVQIDSGELASVQATLGIAHPTGYPLFTIIGYIFSLIPLPFTKIFQLNLLAAIYCITAVGIFTYTIKLCFDNLSLFASKQTSQVLRPKNKKKKKQKGEKEKPQTEISELIKIVTAVFGGLVLAFSKTFWFLSTSVEVYSLHLLLITIIILILVKAYVLSYKNDDIKLWLIFAIMLALGFTNHMTTLLILPGTAYIYFSRYKINQPSVKRVLIMILIFIPVLLIIYSYLPIRALQNPIINWGNPIDMDRILRHISGKQYQVWLFSSMEAAKKQFVYFIEALPLEFHFTLIIAVVGLFTSFIKAKKLFLFLIITFFATVLYSINYDIYDIDSYFLLAFLMIAFFSAFGTVKLFTMKGVSDRVVILILGIVLAIQFYFNFDKVNQSNVYTFEDYTKALVGSVSEDAIILSYQWDFFISESYYYQFVEKYRMDVKIIDKELLRRSWYYNQLNNYDPSLLKGIENEIDQFLLALQPFERSENFDANKLEKLYRTIMSKLITTNIDSRDFYIAPELVEQEMKRGEFSLPPGYNLVPDLFLFKVVKESVYVPAANPDFTIRFPEKRNHYIDSIERFIGTILSNRAAYEIRFGKSERAKVYIQKIISNLPNFRIPPQLQQIVNN
jgi:tetratricopeptide (TPR) repeat protein